MALALKDRVKETTVVTGTGTATLLGSSIGFQPFSVVGNGNTTYYCISDQFGSNWEVGLGTYSSSGNTLARTTVLASSNADALVTFTAGVKDVFVTYPSSKGLWKDASGNAIGLGTPAAFVATNVTGLPLSTGVTGALPVANGGTGVTTSTGTGSTVLSASPTFTGTVNTANLAYTGTLTGSTGVLNIGSGQLYKDASGNVGIGIVPNTSLTPKLEIASTFSAATNGSPYNGLLVESTDAQAGDKGGVISLGGLYDASSGVTRFAAIAGLKENSTSGHFGGYMAFYTRASGSSPAERMRIDSSGNVGIGTTNPSDFDQTGKPLVVGSGSGNQGITIYAGATGYSTVNFADGTIGPARYAGQVSYDHTNNALLFATNTGAERMRIDSVGKVGIGTSNPASILHVAGIKTNQDAASIGQLFISDTSAYNASPTAGVQFGIKYNSAGSVAYGCSVQGIKENATDANFAQGLQFTTQAQGGSPAVRMNIDSTGALILAGSTAQKATGTTWSNPSDIRLKDNITEYAKGLDELMQVSVKEWVYNGKGGTSEGLKGLGVIADEIMLILPNTVENYKAKLNFDDEEDSDIKKFDATEITWLMLKSIQEQQTLIESLTARLTALEAK